VSRQHRFSGKVTGADDRFGVFAYAGVGPSHFDARAGAPSIPQGERMVFVVHFDKLSPFGRLRMHGHFDKLSANGLGLEGHLTCTHTKNIALLNRVQPAPNRRCANAGSCARTCAMRATSNSAVTTPSPSGNTATTSPQGSTTMLCPQVRRPFS
jgi:hypothetical protein